MMLEESLITYALQNGTGVLFGLLMYYMANTTIKQNTDTLKELAEACKNNTQNLKLFIKSINNGHK